MFGKVIAFFNVFCHFWLFYHETFEQALEVSLVEKGFVLSGHGGATKSNKFIEKIASGFECVVHDSFQRDSQ